MRVEFKDFKEMCDWLSKNIGECEDFCGKVHKACDEENCPFVVKNEN